MSVTLVEKKVINFKDPVVIIGFPDVGLVGSIATDYIVDKLNLEEIAYIKSELLPSIVVIENKKIQNLIQIYGREDIIVITSRVPLPAEIFNDLTNVIVDYVISKNSKIVFIITGLPNKKRIEMKKDDIVTYVIPTGNGINMLKNKGNNLQLFDEGIIIGPSAEFIRAFFERNFDSICLLPDCFFNFPDVEASVVVIENLNKIVNLNVDTKSLLEKAEEIRLNVRELMRITKEKMEKFKEKEVPSIMYQ